MGWLKKLVEWQFVSLRIEGFSYFGAMFYRWVKRVLLLMVAMTVFLALAIGMGWLGLEKTLLLISFTMITTGIFVFYRTQKEKVRQAWMRGPALVVHYLSLPLTLLMVLVFRSEQMAHNYWFMVNMAMLVALGLAWLVMLVSLPLPGFARALVAVLSAVYLVLLCLHMCGYFDNGKTIFFGGMLIFTVTILMVIFGIKKPKKMPNDSDSYQTPVAE